MKCVFLFILLFCSVFINAQIAEGTRINAKLQFIKKGKTVNVKVELQFKVISNDSLLIGNLRDYYGFPSLGKFMTELTGYNGTVVKKRGNADSINIAPFNNEVNFTYTLGYDSATFSDATYAPNVGENHVHFAFCQWMLPLTEKNKVLEYSIQVDNLPENWLLYSSVAGEAHDISFKGSLSEFFSATIGAGVFYKKPYTLKGKPLNVYINGSFSTGNERLAELGYKIVSYQRTLFNDFQFSFYNVVLLPKEGNTAGISIPNMFLCLIKKDVDYQKLAWLMSHEMLHRWIGNQITIKDTTSFGLRHQWFKEGINDYLSYLVLLDSKLFTRDEFINSINSYIRNIKENPYSNASEDSIKKVAAAGKYGVAATKLPYYKGGLIGFIADKEFLMESETGLHSRVKDFILTLLKNGKKIEGRIEPNEKMFFSFADSMQLPLYNLYQKHIINGSADFDLPKKVFTGVYKLEKVKYQVYDLGFTFSEKDSKFFASSVDPYGPAYKAGIRNDMEIISSTSVNRFSNAWCDCPVNMVVLVNGERKTVDYIPRGKEVQVLQYIKK